MIKSLIISLICTIVLETGLSYVLGIKKKSDIKLVIMVNIYTNPIVVFIANIIFGLKSMLIYWICVGILEIGAIIIEWIIYKNYLKENVNSLKLSIYNNMFSFFIGLMFFNR